jgi:hypothetical protein
MSNDPTSSALKLVAGDLKILLLSGILWLVFVALGGFSLAILVFPFALFCVLHVALMFSLLRVPFPIKGVASIIAPIPGLMLQWRLLSESEAIDGQALIFIAWQFIAMLSVLACLPGVIKWVKEFAASRAKLRARGAIVKSDG